MTIDLRNMTVILYSATYVPEYPDAIYLHGLDGTIAADKGEAIEWDEVEGVYTGWVHFRSNQFNISTALASTPDGWEEIGDKRIGAATATCNVETNLTVNLKKGEWTNFFKGNVVGKIVRGGLMEPTAASENKEIMDEAKALGQKL